MSKRNAPSSSSANSGEQPIIKLDEGYKRINEEGIQPFIQCIEKQEREFFKAREFVTLYDLIFKMSIQRDPYNWSEALYTKYTESIRDYLIQQTKPQLVEILKHNNSMELMNAWAQKWSNYNLIIKGLSKLFMYLDRFYTPNTEAVLPLREQGYKQYREEIFNEFHTPVRKCVLECIRAERNNNIQDRHVIQQNVNVFIELGSYTTLSHAQTNNTATPGNTNKKLDLYITTLEKFIIDDTVEFYKLVSQQWLSDDSCITYLDKCDTALDAERQRCESYLHRNTIEPLIKASYAELLKAHQHTLLNKPTGLNYMLENKLTSDMCKLYKLYKIDPADLDLISTMFSDFIKQRGLAILEKAKSSNAAAASAQANSSAESKQAEEQSNSTDNTAAAADKPADKPVKPATSDNINHKLVSDLITLHSDYNTIVAQCFDKVQIMQKSLKRAFEDFINMDNRVSKLLAKYANDVLRKNSKVEHVQSVSNTLENIVFLYGYIQDKDVFEHDYQAYLAQRLLKNECDSEHAEKEMIAKLKSECGYQWTNKLEGMFKDVQLSKDLMLEYRQLNNYNTTLDLSNSVDDIVQLDVNVCTAAYWPAAKQFIAIKHPTELQQASDKFKRFYLHKHSGHKLDWRYDQGHAEIVVDFNDAEPVKSRKTLVCSTYQMMILLLFNHNKRVTLKQVIDMTGVPLNELSNHLLTLCHPKLAILLKKPNTKALADDHMFALNGNYKNPLRKIVVPLMRVTEVDTAEQSDENHIIETQRKHQMDAAIVRLMKTRKTMKHNALVTEVAQQLAPRFKPKSNDIKKRIEAMIEQEYLERDHADRSVYNYLA